MNDVQNTPPRRPRRQKVTKWGDGEGRRRDILEAARGLVLAGGPSALTTRDVAARAGVSLGTLYVYFKTKEEIFVTLYELRVEDLAREIDEHTRDAKTFEALFEVVAERYLLFYADYGHALNVWSLIADPASVVALPEALRAGLTARVMNLLVLLGERARAALLREGLVVTDEALALPFVWMVLSGLSEHVRGPRSTLHAASPREVIRFAARTLKRGLTASSTTSSTSPSTSSSPSSSPSSARSTPKKAPRGKKRS